MFVRWIRIGAISGAMAVALGAFGAHGLKPSRDDYRRMESVAKEAMDHRLENFETGVRYHMAHVPALILTGLLGMLGLVSRKMGNAAGWCFALGTLGFSGSLYAMTFGGPTWLGMIVTPTGGLLLIAGWVALAVAAGGKEWRSAAIVD